MSPPNRAYRAMAVALLGLAVTGCAGNRGGNRLAFNPWKGGMKESLSRLEHRNDELQRELADAKDETRRLADELEVAEARGKDLASRLDNFRGLARGDSGALPDPDLNPGRPTRRTGQSPYTPPVTQIPNQIKIPDPPAGGEFEDTAASKPAGSNSSVEYYDLGSKGRSRSTPAVVGRSGGDSDWAPIEPGLSSPRR